MPGKYSPVLSTADCICRVNIVLPDGSTIAKDCALSNTLGEIHGYIREHLRGPSTNFQRADIDLTMQGLGCKFSGSDLNTQLSAYCKDGNRELTVVATTAA
eukprot:1180437-Prorocentrum_minimum.AAC.5